MYSACRIIDRLDPTRSLYNNLFNSEDSTRSDIRERFFRSIFDLLWQNLCQLCRNNENNQSWIYTYTFISKYYPSNKVLQSSQLIDIKNQIEFMNLAYLIFLNEKTPEPQVLVLNLLKDTNINQTSILLKLLPKIIDTIHRYFQEKNIDNSTLLIDLQQWTLSILKSMTQEVNFLFNYLDQSTCQLSFGMKQFLFDELVNISLKFKQQNKQNFDLWDRFDLIPIIIQCASNTPLLQNYQIPYHPLVSSHENHLFDLYFFHLKRQMTNETITSKLLNKGILLKLPKIENRQLIPIAENLFKQLKDYFRLNIIALLLCQTDVNEEEKGSINRILSATVTELLSADQQPIQLSHPLQLFLSIIISKQSWNFLLNLLQSDRIQRVNAEWATSLYEILKLKQRKKENKYLQLCHQIQFTLSSDNSTSIFPKLHQPYEELREIIDTCVKTNQWTSLSEWIRLKQTLQLELNEIKTILFLIIYYDYYCNNQLSSIDTLLNTLEKILQLSSEEIRVFRVLLKPEQFMIGYGGNNLLNNLFHLGCKDEFELSLRHMLVNLMAMILLGGKQSFLWTFVFQPSLLQNTFGFGSTSPNIIQAAGIHYDCGCIITEKGALVRFGSTGNTSVLNVPAVYVAYFSTFGALAWHLLLFDTSVENLHGPILAPSAIADITPAHRLNGNTIRDKVCHFVCTRLLSTFHFLSIQTNPNDACILLTRCFEQMACLTRNQSSWIKPIYVTLNDQVKAEKEYQNEVFYYVYGKLHEYKTYVNQLNLQSQIQTNLQNFIDQMPIIIQFKHFKTELYRPIHSQSSLRILQHIFNSFEILKRTKLIYDLSQFYLLLHQTYTQLIERNEFLTITLKQLYDRGQKHFNHYQQNENKTHRSIIENGIEAVNSYHQFADGLIRPGACDETQRFTTITFDTPVHYLVTTENHDEGDIIMRILSVLIDYHNNSLDLISEELKSNSILKDLVNELVSKEVSILKVANDNTGVMTLNEEDCLWIEQLSQASLIYNQNENILTVNSRLIFDFIYVQSQIIRTYFLVCHISYRHIHQKYQCHTKRIETTDIENLDLDKQYLVSLSNEQLENEWIHLKNMLLDKLYNAYNLLRQIALTLKNSQDDRSSISLYEFITMTDHDNEIRQNLEQYEIKNFQLCYIDHVLKLYAESISSFQHLFTDVHHLLRIPIDTQLNNELIENFDKNMISIDYNNDIDKIHSMIQMITEFINELKTTEENLLQQSTQSLTEICKYLAIENPILSWIPEGIKCENYVAINTQLIRTRSILQERKVNIEEKERKLWDENLNSPDKQQNRFQQYLNSQDEEQIFDRKQSDNWTIPLMYTEDDLLDVDHIEYSSLMELNIKLVPCRSSVFIQQIHKYREELQLESINVTKAQKYTIIHPDGKSNTYLWKGDKVFEQLKKLFDDKKYDQNVFAIVDKSGILIDFTKNGCRLPHQLLLECYIVEKQLLIQVQFHFQTQLFEYLATSKANISVVIQRFIDDNQLKSSSPDITLCFFDEYGKCIDDSIITDFCKTNSKMVSILVIEEASNTNALCEFILQSRKDQIQTNLFHLSTNWQQINHWLKTLSHIIDQSVDNYACLLRQEKIIIDESKTISSIMDQNQIQSVTIDVIDRNTITKVIFTYETMSHSVDALKSTKICSLLNDQTLLQQLNLSATPFDDIVLVVEGTNDRILKKDDLQQTVGTYSTTENQPIHFRISISVQIAIYDKKEQVIIHLSNRNTTIEQLLQSTGKSIDIYKYVASNDTKRILDYNEIISNLNITKFILLKENETCLVSIETTRNLDKENEKYQRYAIFATLADVYKENQLDVLHHYLQYANDFVPSTETKLTSFRSESPIRFIVINGNLPVTVTIENKETQQIIKFNCSVSLIAKRLCSISCRLFGLNHENYQLMQDDGTLIGDDISLEEIDETMNEIQFQLTSTISMYCSVRCSGQTIISSCDHNTLASTIVKETLQILHIQPDSIDNYELIALNDDQTEIDLETSIDDICQLFSSTMTTIPFELRKKNE